MPRIFDKEKLVIANTPEEMRKDGYYYKVFVNKNGVINIFPIVFFEDGYAKSYVFINAVQESIHSRTYNAVCNHQLDHKNNLESALNKTDCFLRNYLFFESEKNKSPQINNNSIDGWGKYYLYDSKLIIRYYYNYKGNYYLTEKQGILLGDKEFLINKSVLIHNGKSEVKNEIYYFRELKGIDDFPNRIKKIN